MKYIYKNISLFAIVSVLSLFTTSCEDFLKAPLPPDKITTDKVFGSASTIEMAMLGTYSKASDFYGAGGIVYSTESLADNLSRNPPLAMDIMSNSEYDLNTSDSFSSLWSRPYSVIYEANVMLENLPVSTAKLSTQVIDQYLAQNLFIRALMHFELLRLFGDVPLILKSDPAESKLIARSPKADVYTSIIADLKDAINKLPETNISGMDARRCANKNVAKALLARVYLHMGDWANAETYATEVINSGKYTLETDLATVLMRRSKEIIFSMDGTMADAPNSCWYYAMQGMPMMYSFFPEPYAWEYSGWGCLTQSAINEFEPGDKRFSTLFTYSAEENVFTLKYPHGMLDQELADEDPQDFCVLRLAEMYLIRAEAKVRKSSPDLTGAAADLNLIRTKHGKLANTTANTQAALLLALEHENRVEFMCESHRWYDIVRTGRADAILSKESNKTGWKSHKSLLPVPAKEIIINKKLVQNQGY